MKRSTGAVLRAVTAHSKPGTSWGCVTVDFDGDRGWLAGHGDGDVVEVA